MAPSMRSAGPQKRYTAYMRTPSGLMPEAVPEGTTRAFVNKTDKRRKAGRAEAGPSEQHSPSVDGEDEGGVFDEEEATQEEDGHCGKSDFPSKPHAHGQRPGGFVAARDRAPHHDHTWGASPPPTRPLGAWTRSVGATPREASTAASTAVASPQATSACRGRVVGCELPHRVRSTGARASVGSLNVRALAGWVQIGNGEFYHRTNLAELGFLVPNCDIALSPEDVVTLSRANRAAQGSGNVCFGAWKTSALDIPQGRRRTSTDYTAKATSRAAATTLERLWEPLGAAISHDELFNGQLRINGRSTGANVTIVISEGSLAAPLCLTRGATCWVDRVNSGPCTISLPIGPDGEAIRVQCVHCALCCPTDAREALQALEGAALSSPLPAVRVCMARGARVAARSGGDASMLWALPGVPPPDGVPGSAAGELNVTFGVDSNQGVLETALDISRRFAECSEQRQVQGLAARKSADPSEWQGWKVEVQTRESAFAQLERASRKRCSRGLMVQVSVSRATSSFECPDLPLVPRATPDELKAAAKRKRDDPDAFAARKAKRDEPDAKATRE
ncbi:hypothetical protein T492DRAFT_911686 [Pavlovales sp. CCMP2436]|nr:hypothetical protein T492DRAFT_911686 [Pavlovales sp. CCMP2436]